MSKKNRNILIIILAIILLVTLFVKSFPKFVLKAEAITPFEDTKNVNVGDEIPIKKGEVLIANSNGRKLYLDTDLLNIRVLDERTGKEWSNKVDDPSNNREKSIMNISYYGKDDKKVDWDSYTIVVEKENYSINKLENGARISLIFESDKKTLQQLLPSYVTIDTFKERFLDPLDALKDKGKITEKQYSAYKGILTTIFIKDLSGQGYKLQSGGISPGGQKRVAQFVETIGYNEEMLIEDNKELGFDIKIPQNPSFKVILDLTLDNGDLVVNIPTYEFTSGNDFFTLLSIEVLPTFGYASSINVPEGYIFVPDGAGALFKLNSYNSSYPHYQRPLYNNTFYDKMYDRDTFKENMAMPVFGIMYGYDKTAQGMLAIIESGEELGTINVQLGTDDISTGGSINNKVYSSVDVSQYSRVKLKGPYSENSTRYLASIGKIDMDYTIRYKLFSENATYDEFAKTYKKYLIDTYNLQEKYSNEPKMYFEVISALTLSNYIAGIPYDKVVSMTTYDELQQIIDELGDMNAIMEYNGAFNDGEKIVLMSEVNLVKENGPKNKLIELVEKYKNSSKEIILGTELMTIKKDNLAFEPKIHSIIGYDSKPVLMFKYSLMDGKFSSNGIGLKYYLNPKFLQDVMSKFINKTQEFENIAIKDIPNTFYGNYDVKNVITPIKANQIIERELSNLSELKRLSFKNPNMNTMPYADIVTDISRESSLYGTMYTSIPFRQLVFNGLVEYTTLNVNMSKKDLDYYLLQAIELGSYPKFTISYKREDILGDIDYKELFNIHFETLKPRIEKLYADYKEVFSQIGTTQIKSHEILRDGVFETTYINGVRVITNYTLKNVSLPEGVIKPMGYKIINS